MARIPVLIANSITGYRLRHRLFDAASSNRVSSSVLSALPGDAYLDPMRDTPMFIPGEPGWHLARLLFGWISGRRLKLFVIYFVSLVAAICGAFALRQLSLRLTTHLDSPREKMAALSFLSSNRTQLRGLIRSAMSDREIRDRLSRREGWILIQAAEGNASVVHVMVDAGMTRRQAKNLALAGKGIKLVFLQRKDQLAQDPFGARARWQPVFIADMDGQRVSQILDLQEAVFQGKPVMPIF